MAPQLPALEKAERRIERQASTAQRSAFAARALGAVADVMDATDQEALAELSAAATNLEVLTRALVRLVETRATEPDSPLRAARVRGIKMREDLLRAGGGVLAVSEVARALGISRQAVDKRRKAWQLLAIDLGKRGYLYPACQFLDEITLRGVADVLRVMKDHTPWSILRFLVNGNSRLHGRPPITLLRNSEIKPVLAAASQFLEHGAA